jgi:hypothetical protein
MTIAARERLNRKRFITRIVILSLSALVTIGIICYIEISSMPDAVSRFWGISLGSTKDEVKLLKGEPSDRFDEAGYWIYVFNEDKTKEREKYLYRIDFKDDRVISVSYLHYGYYFYGSSSNWSFWWITTPKSMEGIKIGDNVGEITKKFGKPSHISISENKSEKVYSYSKYKLFFGMKENRVHTFGIYDPRFGPIELRKNEGK